MGQNEEIMEKLSPFWVIPRVPNFDIFNMRTVEVRK